MLLVHEWLEHHAHIEAARLALVHGDRRLTYREVDDDANRCAYMLQEIGVRRGDRVVLCLPNCLELIIAAFGVLKIGAIFVPLNATMKEGKLRQVLGDCLPVAMVVSASNRATTETLLNQVNSLRGAIEVGGETGVSRSDEHARIVPWSDVMGAGVAHQRREGMIDQDLACLIYTSGSTGDSKGVMSSHANVVFVTTAINSFLRNRSEDVILCTIPLSFDYGLYQVFLAFQAGATLVLERSFAFPGQILRTLETEGVTGLPGVPTLFNMLLQYDLDSFDFSKLRYLTNTAAALPKRVIQALIEKFPWVEIFSMYGLTETKRTLYMPPDRLMQRPDSVGVAIPGTEVWLVDEQDQRLGPDRVGELVVRGRHVMRGYWNNPAATAARYRPGPVVGELVCYTGDLFRRDADGFYYFVGRKDDMLKCRGEKVPPKEVEDVLLQLSEVVEVAVIGVPDEVLGQAIKAFVVDSSGKLTEKDVLRYCRQSLEDYMVPREIAFVESLPKSANGKIAKSALC
jgi:amino acid adenylation domain-containing protein